MNKFCFLLRRFLYRVEFLRIIQFQEFLKAFQFLILLSHNLQTFFLFQHFQIIIIIIINSTNILFYRSLSNK